MADERSAELRGLQAQIDTLGTRMEKGFDEIKTMLSGYEERVRRLELHEANCSPMITSRMDAAWQKINEHARDIDEMKDAITKLTQTNSILRWILGISTAVLTAVLIKLAAGG